MCVHVRVCVSEIDVRYLPLQRSLFKMGLSWNPEFSDWLDKLAGEFSPPISIFPGQVYRCLSSYQGFYMASGDLDTGTQVCRARI